MGPLVRILDLSLDDGHVEIYEIVWYYERTNTLFKHLTSKSVSCTVDILGFLPVRCESSDVK
jgi:hypothetical protein